MVDEKMCVGVERDRLTVQIGPEACDAALKRAGCRLMDFTGRPMRGFVFVDIDVLMRKKDVEYWIGLSLAYNPVAKRSKRRRKK